MKHNRILLKLSGESLLGTGSSGIDDNVLKYFASEIGEAVSMGVEIAVVLGGGNIFRGLSGAESGFDRYKGDQMGMLATVINSLALESALKSIEISTRLFTSIRMEPVGELYHRDSVLEAMKNKTVSILAGGTGNPFFTTDTAAALRAVETGSDLLLKGTRVDGVFSADPEETPTAKRYDRVTYDQVINEKLRVMDLTAFTMCRENRMPIVVFNMNKKGNLVKILNGEPEVGTMISS